MAYTPYLVQLADMRNEGVGNDVATDAQLLDAIEESERYIRRKTRQDFNPVTLTLKLDGSGNDTLPLPAALVPTQASPNPITSITVSTETYANTPTVVDPVNDVVIYQRVPWADGADDRMNNKIVWKQWRREALIINGSDAFQGKAVWPFGNQNVQVTGTFGFVEDDGLAPISIRRAARRLAYLYLGQIADPETADKLRQLRIKNESTDAHSYGLDGSDEFGDIGDRWVDRVLARYTRRIRKGTRPRLY